MDTIIYLYHCRGTDGFATEKWQESDYCLIRLGIPEILWQKLQEQEVPEECAHKDAGGSIFSRIKNFFTSGKTTGAKSQNKVGMNPVTEKFEELRDLQQALILLGDNPYRTYCVYEKALTEKIDSARWRQYWNIPEFDAYNERMWVDKLMPHTIPGGFLILGYADCLAQILCENARKMRSVKWWLKEKQCTSDLQVFLEDFYEEYGLAVEVHLLENEADWFGVRPSSVVPVNVLDFTGEEKLSACDVARGSIWLDMDSLDGKWERMEARNPGINYFSLKNQWKQRQKEAICLDTINKNGYNT